MAAVVLPLMEHLEHRVQLSATGTATAPAAVGAGLFSVMPMEGGDRGHGFALGTAKIGTPTGALNWLGTPVMNETDVSVEMMRMQTEADGTIQETWRGSRGEFEVDVTLGKPDADTSLMRLHVINGTAGVLTDLEISAPWITGPDVNTLRIYNPGLGGHDGAWPTQGFTTGNTSAWPNFAYSPIAVFYDAASTQGVGLTSFDDGLGQRTIFWVTQGGGTVAPYVRWNPFLAQGQSQSTTVEEHRGANMPTAHFDYYRQRFLQPYMNAMGIDEGSFKTTGAWAISMDLGTGTVADSVSQFKALGAKGVIQWPAPDGPYFEPDATTQDWFRGVPDASRVPGMDGLGVVIDPYVKSRKDPANAGPQSLLDPAVMASQAALRDRLAAAGVTFAFWDQGSAAGVGETRQYVHILNSWKKAGITIGGENASDVNAYITGATLRFQYQWDNDYALVHHVTPLATTFMWDQSETPNANGVYWWQDAAAKGLVPILNRNDFAAAPPTPATMPTTAATATAPAATSAAATLSGFFDPPAKTDGPGGVIQ